MERTPAIEHLVALVKRVTSRIESRQGIEMTEEDVSPIMQCVAPLTPEELGLSSGAHAYITPPAPLPGNIRYLHIAQEDDAYSIGVFVLPPGACIPLHDHPNMSVVSHILYGTVKITCYDRVQENVASASQGGHTPAAWGYPMQGQDFGSEGRGLGGGGGGGGGARWGETFFGQQPDLSVLRESAWHQAPHTSCLTPSKANVHQLEAGNHGVGILDVLIPPYDEACGRDCTYYRAEATTATATSATTAGGRGGSSSSASSRRFRLVPTNPGDHYAVVRGDFVPPFPR